MGITATRETAIVSYLVGSKFCRFLPKTRIEGGNYYANKLLFSNCFAYCSDCTLTTPKVNEVGTSCVWPR